jgi:DNA-binding CsgD family transcriptional regulator
MAEQADAVEAERQRLAALLDDDIVHPLDLLLAQAAAYEQAFPGVPEVQLAVSALTAMARQVRQRALDLQANLKPVLLDVAGLDVALDMLAQQFIRDTGVQVNLKIARPDRERLPAAMELALFRATQDMLASSRRAGATQIELQFIQSGQLTLSARDNGRQNMPRGLLDDTVQRVDSMGGQITILPAEVRLEFQLMATASLTIREREVLALVINGLTNKEIAQRLSLSERTINFHLNNVYSKLHVSTRTEAVVHALRYNLLK